jgi:hypothetical protein
MNDAGRVADSFVARHDLGTQDTLSREERHLRVVRDRSTSPVLEVVVGDPCRSVLGADLVDIEEKL